MKTRLGIFALACMLILPCGVRADSQAVGVFDPGSVRGRVVYLDFWASWCAPCRQSFPWMQIVDASYRPEGLVLIAVNLDQSRGDAERFIATFHPTFDIRFDPTAESAQKFHVQGMPTSVLLDRSGAVRYVHTGFRLIDRAIVEQEIQLLLNEPPPRMESSP